MIVTDREGSSLEVDGEAGQSVMAIIRDAGIDQLLALCGGCCSCATCHIYVETPATGAFPPMSEDENDLLDCSDHRRGSSRLACQLPFTDALDGMRVWIAPED